MSETENTSAWSRIVGIPLHWQIAIALALAALVAALASETSTLLTMRVVDILDFFGGLFLNALKMVVVPLIVSSIIVGVRNMATQDSFGRVGGKTVGLYIVTGIAAVATGLILVNLLGPGTGESAKALTAALPDASQVLSKVEGRGHRRPDPGDLPGDSTERHRGRPRTRNCWRSSSSASCSATSCRA